MSGGGNKRSMKYVHGTPGHPHNYQAHFSQQDTAHLIRGTSGKASIDHGMSNKSPSLFEQNTHFLDMSGNLGSHFGHMAQVPQEMMINDSLSAGGIH